MPKLKFKSEMVARYAAAATARNIARERAIGVHPGHRNAAARKAGPTEAEWLAMADAWDAANPLEIK